MRFLLSVVLIALLLPLSFTRNSLPLVPGAHAGEVKYKERRQQQPQTQETQAKSKRPPDNRPRERPPDKYDPPKEPPPGRPPDTRPPQPPPPPPPRPDPQPYPRDCRDDRWYPPSPPVGCDPVVPVPIIMPSPPEIVELYDILSRRLRAMELEGFEGQVAVGWDRQVYFEQSYGYPPVSRGYYDIASVTRAFTAWATYELIESGKLALGTTLGELFPGAPHDKRGITIEQLLANTSGLGNTYAADAETDRDTAVSNLLAQPLAHTPGAEFTYSDDGYVVLAAAIEVASGMAYESYMLDSGVVGPDMKQTVFWGEAGPPRAHWGQRGSGGILSTARDLYRWTSRFLAGPDFVVEEITRPRVLTESGEGVGYGWFWRDPDTGAPVLWTSGIGSLDHNVRVIVYPSHAILVVTSDRFHGDVPWSERVANTLEPFLRMAEPPPPRWTVDTTLSTTGD